MQYINWLRDSSPIDKYATPTLMIQKDHKEIVKRPYKLSKYNF